MVIIMLGAPATGKGTVAGMLSKELGIKTVSSGDIFRKHISEGTEIGKKLDTYLSKGELVPDELVIEMIGKRILEPDLVDGVILDGFPRTEVQAKKLDELLAAEGKEIKLVVNLTTPREELIERTISRRNCTNHDCNAIYNLVSMPPKQEGICDKCGSPLYQRDDAKLEVAENRLAVYERETAPLVEYYAKTGKLFSTVLTKEGNRMGDTVTSEVVKVLKGE